MGPDNTASGAGTCDAAIDKREARRCGLAARDALQPAERDTLAAALRTRALGLPELQTARTVMLFASIRSEPDTEPLLDWVLRSGKTLCLPRILAPRRMSAFHVRDLSVDLTPGTWRIPEPREHLPEIPPEKIDLVFVPGSAFDERGGRCGYGGGFYDNFLSRTRPGTPRVALVFEVQLLPQIVCEPHDLPVTVIVTERRVIRPGAA